MLYVREAVAASETEDLAWSGWIDAGWTQSGPVAAGWRELGTAEGDVIVPSGADVALEIEFARSDLSPAGPCATGCVHPHWRLAVSPIRPGSSRLLTQGPPPPRPWVRPD